MPAKESLENTILTETANTSVPTEINIATAVPIDLADDTPDMLSIAVPDDTNPKKPGYLRHVVGFMTKTPTETMKMSIEGLPMTKEQLDNYDLEKRESANNLIMEIRLRLMDLIQFARLQAGLRREDIDGNEVNDTAHRCLNKVMEYHPMSDETYNQWSLDNAKFLLNAYISTTTRRNALTIKNITPKKITPKKTPKWLALVEEMQSTLETIGEIIQSTENFSPTTITSQAIGNMEFNEKERATAKEWLLALDLALESSLENSTFQPLMEFTIPFYSNDEANKRIKYMQMNDQLELNFDYKYKN